MPYIDFSEAIDFRQAAADHLPGRPHVNSVRRWAQKGVNGVRLRSVKFAGKRLTTPQWCEEFVQATCEATPDAFEDARACAELDALGV